MAGKTGTARITASALFQQIRHPQKRAFLIAYSELSSTERSVAVAKIHRALPYHWRRTDPLFAQAWEEAKAMVAEALEEEAIRRAKDYEETHYTADGTPYPVMKHSDTLLIFLLKGAMPAKYRERYEHTGQGGGPVQVQVVYQPPPEGETP